MLDVHPPHHAANTWRDFFIHIATICIGLLIAIGLEQGVEALHHRHQRHELETQLREEAQRNLDLTRINLARLKTWTDWYDANIVALNTAAVTNGRIKRSVLLPPGHVFDIDLHEPAQTTWAIAKANATVGLLAEDEAQVYARLDHEIDQLVPAQADLTRDRSTRISYGKAKRGLSPAQLEWLPLDERDSLLRLLSSSSSHAVLVANYERNVAGACKGVLHGARSVSEMLQYMIVEANAQTSSTQTHP